MQAQKRSVVRRSTPKRFENKRKKTLKGFDIMKRLLAAVMALTIVGLTACGDSAGGDAADSRERRPDISSSTEEVNETQSETASDEQSQESSQDSETETSQSSSETSEETESSEETTGSGILIAYFSLGENNGISGDVDADAGASVTTLNGSVTGNTGIIADYIRQATGGDMFSILTEYYYPESYDETLTVARDELSNGERPALASHIENLDQYDTIFIGFPNWWADMPAPMDTFFEEYDFSGKRIIPFVTSGGSGFSDTLDEIAAYEPDATLLEGLSIRDYSVEEAQGEVNDWIAGLGL